MSTLRLTSRPRRFVLAAGIACLVGAAALGGAPASAATTVGGAHASVPADSFSWAVAPSTANGPDGRSHFSYTGVQPNTAVHDYVGINNYSTQPVTFNVYASDGVTTSAGSIGLAAAKDKAVDIGAWIRFEHNTVTVPARSRLNEPITLNVPPNATPGDHVGGVIASVTEAAIGGKVTRDDRVGVAVYLRVAGPLHPALSVESVTTNGYHGTFNPFTGGSTSVSYTVHNTGNVRLAGNQTVTVTGPFGIGLATVHPKAIQEILPGGSVRFTAHLSGIFPAGPLSLHVDVTSVAVPGSPHISDPLRSGSYTLGLWAAPWVPLVMLVLLIAAAYGIYRWLRRRRRDRAGALAAAVERGRKEAVAQLASVGGREPSSEDTAASSAADPE
ncbi:MAG TPA: DUF916 domain-containing protein [Pseudonocardiaceae bacterium]|jgi:hypothetical protein|nr:DUF916 domain-containing protein [Pseudonocardiaceae bacterium]